ncbi:MAG: hypothetical protein WBH99_08900 [Azovibrio sp.]|uniref:hypothetical protein n=1 Tax=Azovibrio sp. TaxID=1872673 RepID=UPI003C77D082
MENDNEMPEPSPAKLPLLPEGKDERFYLDAFMAGFGASKRKGEQIYRRPSRLTGAHKGEKRGGARAFLDGLPLSPCTGYSGSVTRNCASILGTWLVISSARGG